MNDYLQRQEVLSFDKAYPSVQEHSYPPGVFSQSWEQLFKANTEHSSISMGRRGMHVRKRIRNCSGFNVDYLSSYGHYCIARNQTDMNKCNHHLYYCRYENMLN